MAVMGSGMGAVTADDSAYRYDKDGETARMWARAFGLQWSWRSHQWMTPAALERESRAAEIAFMEKRRRQDEWSAYCGSQYRYYDARERAGR